MLERVLASSRLKGKALAKMLSIVAYFHATQSHRSPAIIFCQIELYQQALAFTETSDTSTRALINGQIEQAKSLVAKCQRSDNQPVELNQRQSLLANFKEFLQDHLIQVTALNKNAAFHVDALFDFLAEKIVKHHLMPTDEKAQEFVDGLEEINASDTISYRF